MNEKRFERVQRLITGTKPAYPDRKWTQIIAHNRPYFDGKFTGVAGWAKTPKGTLIARRFPKGHLGREADDLAIMVWTGIGWREMNHKLIDMIELALWPEL